METIPLGMEDLRRADAETTAEALIRLVGAARSTIDLTALYWSLRPDPDAEDTAGWTPTELVERLGAGHGLTLFRALEAAASRGVRIRILESPGFGRDDAPQPPPASDSTVLRAAHADRVEVRRVDLEGWYGSGIMHQKIWVVDGAAVYVGSANTDWRSLSQVKELGIVVEDAPDVAAEATRWFETWWSFALADPADEGTEVVAHAGSRRRRRVPAWSTLVDAGRRRANPLERDDLRTPYGWDTPLRVRLGDEDGDVVLSGAPRELCVGQRPFDEDLLVATILDARTSVCVNVMDFAPVSLRAPADPDAVAGVDEPAAPVWWPALVDALVQAVTTNAVHARLLVSEWAHTSPVVAPYLVALDATARAAAANPRVAPGTLEIRRFRVPGWRRTVRTDDGRAPYPGHTRVNHAKYIVTDRRINVGTSNMTWDYFSGTAGTSFNADNPSLVRRLQDLFERDWDSDYALPL